MALEMERTEHTLEQQELFNEYLQLYEDRLGDYIGENCLPGAERHVDDIMNCIMFR